MKKVYTVPIDLPNGNASKEFHSNSIDILGNKYIKMVIEKTFPDGQNTYGKIPLVTADIISQVDENGNNLTIFSFDANNNLVSSIPITDIVKLSFNDKFRIRRNSGSGSSGDADDKFSIQSLNIDIATNTVTEATEIMEPVADTYSIAVGDEITKRRIYNVALEEDLSTGLPTTIGLAWELKDLKANELQLKKLRIIIEIFYIENNEGGN